MSFNTNYTDLSTLAQLVNNAKARQVEKQKQDQSNWQNMMKTLGLTITGSQLKSEREKELAEKQEALEKLKTEKPEEYEKYMTRHLLGFYGF